jgi:hypothetical protein
MSKISIKGALLGAGAYIVLDYCLDYLLGYYGAPLLGAISNRDPHLVLMIVGMLAGPLIVVIGGFLAAWLAGHNEVLNGCISSLLVAGLIAVESLVLGLGRHPSQTIVYGASGPAFGLFGGCLRYWQQSSSTRHA